jgi:hypothetical protein
MIRHKPVPESGLRLEIGTSSTGLGKSLMLSIVCLVLHGCVLLAAPISGQLVGWGGDLYGQADVPVGLSNVVAVAAGGGHSLALKNDGTVVGWGKDYSHEVPPPEGLSNVVAIAAVGEHINSSRAGSHLPF